PPGAPPRVALTFDDGPSMDTPAVLAALEREGIRATFFILGRHAEQHPQLVRSIALAGHEIGNHTWSHRVLALARPGQLAAEIDRTQQLLARLCLRAPRLFRAPRGYQGPLVRAALRRRGLALIGWTRGAWDSERRAATDIAALAAAKPRDGDILLLHDGAGTPGEQRRDRTAEAIPLIVREYRRRGFRFVTVPELLHG
ncbi:MAG: polysaccharide deacetylase family protein, partial [Gemmatimonadales bacterium]